MVFEKVIKKLGCGCHRLPSNLISVANSSVSLGSDIAETFAPDKKVEIWLDRDAKRVGLKPTDIFNDGYALSKTSIDSLRTTLNNKHIVNMLEVGRYNVIFEDGMWIISADSKIE